MLWYTVPRARGLRSYPSHADPRLAGLLPGDQHHRTEGLYLAPPGNQSVEVQPRRAVTSRSCAAGVKRRTKAVKCSLLPVKCVHRGRNKGWPSPALTITPTQLPPQHSPPGFQKLPLALTGNGVIRYTPSTLRGGPLMAWPTTSNPKKHFVNLRLTDAEAQDLDGAASLAGMSRSAYVREALRRVTLADKKAAEKLRSGGS